MPSALNLRSVRAVYFAAAAGTIVWLAAIFLAPWLAGQGAFRASRLVYALFSPVCHQIPGRCLTFAGHPLAVCGRCLGIYIGFAVGLVLYPIFRGFSRLELPGVRAFLLLTIPMAVDGMAGILRLWASPVWVRLATGFAWGAILPFYFVTGVADLLASRRERSAVRELEKAAGKKVE